MTKWKELHDRFKKISEITGSDKSSSFSMLIYFSNPFDNKVNIEMGTYDIGDLPRRSHFEFNSEEEALIEIEKFIEKCEKIAKKEFEEDIEEK